jgi:hypothetical protein
MILKISNRLNGYRLLAPETSAHAPWDYQLQRHQQAYAYNELRVHAAAVSTRAGKLYKYGQKACKPGMHASPMGAHTARLCKPQWMHKQMSREIWSGWNKLNVHATSVAANATKSNKHDQDATKVSVHAASVGAHATKLSKDCQNDTKLSVHEASVGTLESEWQTNTAWTPVQPYIYIYIVPSAHLCRFIFLFGDCPKKDVI